jgi:hypothetical protein
VVAAEAERRGSGEAAEIHATYLHAFQHGDELLALGVLEYHPCETEFVRIQEIEQIGHLRVDRGLLAQFRFKLRALGVDAVELRAQSVGDIPGDVFAPIRAHREAATRHGALRGELAKVRQRAGETRAVANIHPRVQAFKGEAVEVQAEEIELRIVVAHANLANAVQGDGSPRTVASHEIRIEVGGIHPPERHRAVAGDEFHTHILALARIEELMEQRHGRTHRNAECGGFDHRGDERFEHGAVDVDLDFYFRGFDILDVRQGGEFHARTGCVGQRKEAPVQRGDQRAISQQRADDPPVAPQRVFRKGAGFEG